MLSNCLFSVEVKPKSFWEELEDELYLLSFSLGDR